MNLIPMLEQNAAHRLTRLIVLQLRSCRLHVLLVRIFLVLGNGFCKNK